MTVINENELRKACLGFNRGNRQTAIDVHNFPECVHPTEGVHPLGLRRSPDNIPMANADGQVVSAIELTCPGCALVIGGWVARFTKNSGEYLGTPPPFT
jgi:hypothetical protein